MKYFIVPITLIIFILASVAGWLVHIFTCLSDQLWGFLIAGAIFFPIGIIHGWGVTFGWW